MIIIRRIICQLLDCRSICIYRQQVPNGAFVTLHLCERCNKERVDQFDGVA